MTNTQHNQTTQAEGLGPLLVALVALLLCIVLCVFIVWQDGEINRLRGDLEEAYKIQRQLQEQHQDGNQQQAPEQQRGRLRDIGDQVRAFERQTLEAREELKK